MKKKLLWCVVAAGFLSACSDDPKPAPAPQPDMDVGADDVAPMPDVEGEGEPDDVDPGLTEAAVTSGEVTVRVSFEPFVLSVEDGQGQVRAQTSQRAEVPFSGVAFARVAEFNPNRFYNPTLLENERDVFEWFSLGAVRRGEMDGEVARFVVRSQDEAGVAGPDVTLEIAPTEHSVSLRVVLADDEAIVFNNLTLNAAEGEGYYGFGELFDRLDGRGLIREMQLQVEGSSESGTNEVHVPVPFVMSSARFGLFLDDKHPAAFDMGATHGDAARLTSLSRDATVHFFVDDEPMKMVESYTAVSGKPALVPFWSLAPQWWRNVNRDQAEVLTDARRGRELDIPSTVMWIDRPWSSYYHNWRFNRVQFPDPEGMFEELHEMGYRVLLHHSPQMNRKNASDIGEGEDDSEDLFAQFVENGWLVTIGEQPLVLPWGGGQGGHIDWSNPEAVEAVQGHLRRATDLGVIGTKMDWDEFLQANAGAVRINVDYFNGESPLTMRIRYSSLYHKAIIEGFNEAMGEQSFHVSRSGTPGDQVWSTCIWPGDLDNDLSEHTRGPSELQEDWNVGGLPAAIVANQSLGMSGFPCFASDIGGFRNGSPEEEALLRWMAFGVFNAITQLGGGGRTHMAWSEDTEYSEEALVLTRKFFKLRMSLVPYVFQNLLEAHRTGRPLVRSLWLAHPEDPEARVHERDFLFGPDLLVAPVFTPGATERALYLPEGRWVDFWTGESFEGGRVVTRAAPLDLIPVYVRAGGIVPMISEDIDTLLPVDDESIVDLQDRPDMRLLIAPGEGRQLELYNGLSVSTVPGEGSLTVEVSQGAPDPTVDARVAIAPPTIGLEVLLGGTDFDGSATLSRGGEPEVALEAGEEGCVDCLRRDEGRGLVRIVLSGAGRVVIR